MNAAELLVEERPDNSFSRADSIPGGMVADVACVLLSALAFICIALDSDTWVRAPAMLAFVLFVPGWTLVRRYGAPATLVVCLGAIGLSIGSMLLLGELLVIPENALQESALLHRQLRLPG